MTVKMDLPIVPININPGFGPDKPSKEELESARLVIDALKAYGAFIAKPNLDITEQNVKVLRMMTKLFAMSEAEKQKYIVEHNGVKYETGYMPRYAEIAENTPEYEQFIRGLTEHNKPQPSRGRNSIERFMHAIGPRPAKTKYPELNIPAIDVPEIAGFKPALNAWGELTLPIAFSISEYIAVGLGLPPNGFRDLLQDGPHLFAPTGVNLVWEYCMYRSSGIESEAERVYKDFVYDDFQEPRAMGAFLSWLEMIVWVLDEFHGDLNFISIHGRSTDRALAFWTAEGIRYWSSAIPDGCMLVQAGRQLRHLTGGIIPAMYHEVTTNPSMVARAADCLKDKKPPIRVGCPIFVHVRSDAVMTPLVGDKKQYAPIEAGAFVKDILNHIYGNG